MVGGVGGPTDYFVTLSLSWGWVEAVTINLAVMMVPPQWNIVLGFLTSDNFLTNNYLLQSVCIFVLLLHSASKKSTPGRASSFYIHSTNHKCSYQDWIICLLSALYNWFRTLCVRKNYLRKRQTYKEAQVCEQKDWHVDGKVLSTPPTLIFHLFPLTGCSF